MKRRRIFLVSAFLGVIFLFVSFSPAYAATSDVIITEIMFNPTGADTDHEWLELKNIGSDSVEVIGGSSSSGWRLFDGSNHTFSTSTVLSSNEFLILAQDEIVFLSDHPSFVGKIIKSSFNLGNSSSTVALRIGSDGIKWSEITYDSAWGGAGNGKSLEKKNLSGDNSAGNWQESAVNGGTPGVANSEKTNSEIINENVSGNTTSTSSTSTVIETPVATTPAPTVAIGGSVMENDIGRIIINEFFSDPASGEKEWVELFNQYQQALDLSGWKMEEGSEEETILTGVIPGRGYFLIQNPRGKLNNSGDVITIYDGYERLQDRVVYGNWDDGNKSDNAPVAYDGQSVGRRNGLRTGNDKNDFRLSTKPTPSAENLLRAEIPSTTVTIAKQNVNISETETTFPLFDSKIIINEILPNPKGRDNEAEYIELKNIGTEGMDLSGWRLVTSGKQSYFLTTTTLSAGNFLVLHRRQSKIALKNSSGERLDLFDAGNRLADQVNYDDTAEEDFSFNRLTVTSTSWIWSTALTPGRENIIVRPNFAPEVFVVAPTAILVGEEAVFDASDTFDSDGDELIFQWRLVDNTLVEGEALLHVFEKAGREKISLTVTDGHGHQVEKKMTVEILSAGEVASEETDDNAKVVNKKSSPPANIQTIPLQQIRYQTAGDWAQTRGWVAVLPGVFSTQMFYIVDKNSLSGLGVYLYKKDFPSLRLGELVEITGELGNYQGALRLKVKNRGDIQKIKGEVADVAQPVKSADLDDGTLNALVEISGEVVEVNGSSFVLADDQGEILTQIKHGSGIKAGAVKEGDLIRLIGLVGLSKNKVVVWPRQPADLAIIGIGAGINREEKPTTAGSGHVNGYITATAGGMTSLFLALLARSRGAVAKSVAVGLLAKTVFWKKNKNKDSL